MPKCSAKCKYYQAYMVNNDKIKVTCVITGHKIKYIKENMSDIYNNCDKFVLDNKYKYKRGEKS